MSRKAMSKEEFKKAFDKIKNKPIQTTRGGDTGVGHTLETLLGLEEDNLDRPDLGFAELKAHRKGSNALITLFTFDRKAWLLKQKEVIKKFGYEDDEGRQALKFQFRHDGKLTKVGLTLSPNKNKTSVSLISKNNEVVAEWKLDSLANKFLQKMPALVVVTAENTKGAKGEEFKYTEAKFYAKPSPELICQQILAGNVCVDLRMHIQDEKVRNRGTAFRVYEGAIGDLFGVKEKL